MLERFSDAGFTSDLLPVIPPDAAIGPGSSLAGKKHFLGKVPGRYSARFEQWHGFINWPQHVTTHVDLDEWKTYPGPNIGLQARNTPGIDIDVESPPLADEIQSYFESVLGPAPTRYRDGTARRLLIYQCVDAGRKLIARHEASEGAVELLHAGNQYVVWGTHPSRMRYYWNSQPRSADLTPVSRMSLEWAMRGLAELGFSTAHQKRGRPKGRASSAVDPDALSFYSRIFELPNTSLNDWVNVCCPFHADTRPSLSVNLRHGGFLCHACQVRGGSIKKFDWLLRRRRDQQ